MIDKLKMLVTGGAGFIGSHVAEYYAAKGHDVTVFDNLKRSEILKNESYDRYFNWNYLKKYANIKFVQGDIRNLESLREAANGSEAIIHLAGQVAVTSSIMDPRTDFEVNSLGTFNVLETARLNDSTIIYSSTNKVYGENVNKIEVVERQKRYEFDDQHFTAGIPEEFPIDLTGHTPYGCSKLAADIYVQDYAQSFGLRTGVFRQSCIYGERQFGVEDQGWVAWFVIAAKRDMEITLYGNGKQVRDVLHISDLVQAFDHFLNSNVEHEVFNIGGGPRNTLSLIELVDILQEQMRKRIRFRFAEWRPHDQKIYVSNTAKAEKMLGWSPKVDPRTGVGDVIRWVSDNLRLFSN